MKIACVLVTRGHPRRAAAVMECAKSLASGEHELVWVIGCDSDDPAESNAFFRRNYPDVRVSVEEAPNGVGAVWNRGARLVPDADLIAPFPDDSFPGLPDWDKTMAENLPEPDRLGVIAWNDTANPGQCTLPVITRKWFELCGLYDERFPFWFYDTCVSEMCTFITGRPVRIPKALLLAAKKGKTKSMRDLAFWWGFYSHTRAERLEKAKAVRAQIGIELPADVLRTVIENWEHRDNLAAQHFDAMERNLSAAEGPPSERYINAKAVAETYFLKGAA